LILRKIITKKAVLSQRGPRDAYYLASSHSMLFAAQAVIISGCLFDTPVYTQQPRWDHDIQI